MSDIAIRVESLSKQYRIGARQEGYKTLRDQVAHGITSLFSRNGHQTRPNSKFEIRNSKSDTIWALHDVSFEIKPGEVVGIIGRNGAGKSTLLKILSRITEPTEGYVEIHGRVGSLLEVGTGFHPELTGRENIYLSGAILGMKRLEISRKFDEIVAFAEVEKFIDTPIKHYSSGMYMRLAFAVAAHLEPEVLLVDEVLAVGDADFQRKCLGKMENVAHEGRVVLFVSHNMAAVQRLCTRGCLIESGKLAFVDDVDKVVSFYLKSVQERADFVSLAERTDRSGNGSLRFTGVTLFNKHGEIVSVAQSGEELVIALDYTRTEEVAERAVVCLRFADAYGHGLFQCLSRSSHNGMLRLPLEGQVRCKIPRLPLLRGRYDVTVWCKINEQSADRIEGAFRIEVAAGDFFKTGKHNPEDGGSLLVDHSWKIHGCAQNVG
jgi:lipopolysaccharide transport system ATP-binding protein